VFVSILLHELGHVLMGRAFGSDGHIVLHSMGGLAIGSTNLRRRWQRIAVLGAGPGVQLLLFVPLWLVLTRPWPIWQYRPQTPMQLAGLMLLEINLFWPILNLLPVWPLDGGQITREVCEGVAHRQGRVVSLWISLVVSAVLAVLCLLAYNGHPIHPWVPRDMFLAIFFALFAVGSYQALQVERTQKRFWDEDWPWGR
jgi:Zn-dependent protease